MDPVIVVHGGAGTHAAVLHDEVARKEIEDGVRASACAGYQLLREGGSAMDAVEAAIMYMENHPGFNAGYGSYLTQEGKVEMDASIMDGATQRGGGVSCVTRIKNAVQLAKLVMDKTDHVLMTAVGAEKFALECGLPAMDQADLLTEKAIGHLKKFAKFNPSVKVEFHERGKSWKEEDGSHDTVGAVAIDAKGNVASASSTGGINAKLPGRVGDSAIIGCGCFSDNRGGAVTSTGHGEAFIKVGFSRSAVQLMKEGTSPTEALARCLDEMLTDVKGTGGAIAVNNQGETGVSFNTEGMSWCRIKRDKITYGIYKEEELTADYEA